jgi:hypothetical protein
MNELIIGALIGVACYIVVPGPPWSLILTAIAVTIWILSK